MKRRTLAGVAALTLFDIVAAQAQTPPPVNWSGFYTGFNVGYRFADLNGTSSYAGLPQFPADFFTSFSGLIFPFPTTTTSMNPSSAVGGLHAGYNYDRIWPNILIGFESDIVWGRGKKSTSWSFSDPGSGQYGYATFSTSIDWQASLRGRLGYWSGPWLFYATGGLSIVQVKFSGFGGFGGAGSFDCSGGQDSFSTCDFSTSSAWAFSSTKILPGGVIGGGIEYLYQNQWMFRVEYLYADYGTVRFANFGLNSSYSDNFNCGGNGCPQTVVSAASALGGQASAHLTTQTVRFAVSYRWGP